jgi:hypothetical protein
VVAVAVVALLLLLLQYKHSTVCISAHIFVGI